MKRDPARIDVLLGALGAYLRSYPDLRLCQIVANCLNLLPPTGDAYGDRFAMDWRGYNLEDEEFLALLSKAGR